MNLKVAGLDLSNPGLFSLPGFVMSNSFVSKFFFMNSFMNLFIDQHISMCMFVIHFILSHIEIACNITLVYIFFYKIFYIVFFILFLVIFISINILDGISFQFPFGDQCSIFYSILPEILKIIPIIF